jgi:hypothetical protein
MYRVDLGGGAVAFELEKADRVASFNPSELRARGWTPEAIENYRRYRQRFNPSAAQAEPATPPRTEAET